MMLSSFQFILQRLRRTASRGLLTIQGDDGFLLDLLVLLEHGFFIFQFDGMGDFG